MRPMFFLTIKKKRKKNHQLGMYSNEAKVSPHRVLKCDIKFSFFAFQHFHDRISVEHDEKPSYTKFDMNWFMVAQDMAS